MRISLFFVLLILNIKSVEAESAGVISADSVFALNKEQLIAISDSATAMPDLSFAEKSMWLNKGIKILQKLTKENKKITAAVLTVTLGMLGVHRLYLGTRPWVPAAYLFTVGGCFFILPFIDLVVILFSDDMSRFENNGMLFMWSK